MIKALNRGDTTYAGTSRKKHLYERQEDQRSLARGIRRRLGGVPQARRKDVFPHDQSHLQLPAPGSYDSTSQTEQLSRNLSWGITGSRIEIMEGVWNLADE
jgi:hypothetical protein